MFDYVGPSTGGTTSLTFPSSPEELNEYSDPQGNAYPKNPFGDYFVDATVTIQEQPTIEAGPDQYVCADVVSVTMAGYSFTGATGADWSGGAGSWAGDVYSPTSGEIASGSVILTYTTNTADPCPEISDFMTVYFYPLPVLSTVTLQASTSIPGPPWDYLVSGDIGGGYAMCITSAVDNYFLDINTLISSPALATDLLNPFTLNTASLPSDWWSYWAAKGVIDGSTGWQGQMWQIINGWSPFFYIKYSSGTDYKLVDGLQYWLYGGEPVLTVPGDYPNHNYTYDGTVTDVNGCVSLPISVVMAFNACDITGSLKYNNTAQTGLNGMTVTLNSTPAVSATTGAGGVYTLSSVPSGTYSLTFNDNGKTVGSINATDAAQVNYWGVASWTIEKVRFFAGDVNNDNNLVALDAQQILAYFINAGNVPYNFIPDWKFWLAGDMINANPYAGLASPSITIASSSTGQDLYGLCSGDFNQSFIPGTSKSASETLTLKYGESIFVGTEDVFELPIYAGMDMDVGAISLIINLPEDMIEVMDVFMGENPIATMLHLFLNGELRIGWNSLTPVYLSKGEKLLTLKLKLISPTGEEGIVPKLAGDPLNELADSDFAVIDDAVIVMDLINNTGMGWDENKANQLTLTNQPNPFHESTIFTYNIPVDGKVTIEVYDLVGNLVKVLVDETKEVGHHQVILNSGILKPGVYTANLKLNDTKDVHYKTIKIISR